MSRWAITTVGALVDGYALAPQRYVPAAFASAGGVPIRALAELVIESRRAGEPGYLVDTTDLADGVIRGEVRFRGEQPAGSTKRAVRRGDVLISRLRPYLRQVAYVDAGLPPLLLASTELLALRAPAGDDLAFLLPFLLGPPVQAALLGSVEGGQHPRFRPERLLELRVPEAWVARREGLGAEVRRALGLRRQSERALAGLMGGG